MSKKSVNGTDCIHGDSAVSHGAEVAPSISVSTTFRQAEVLPNTAEDARNPEYHVYSRYTQSISTRTEHVLSKINDGFAITYASGIAASNAALVYHNPRRLAIREGYHGVHVAIDVWRKAKGKDFDIIDIDDEFRPGDLCWLESPLNPTGESRDIKYYADKIHAVGGSLIIDSTFGPPPLQYPFNFGADMILHSATKYFGGHSDLLGGILITKSRDVWEQLYHNRTYMGNMMGSLESWLLLRSLRTFHLRVPRQSETATKLAQWLNGAAGKAYDVDGIPGGVIARVWHSSLQPRDKRGFDPKSQMTGGWNATFAILTTEERYGHELPYAVKYFVPATSLGGVESLMEHRIRSDPSSDPRLIRISVGVEDLEDLKNDLRRAFKEVATKVKPKL